MAAFHFAFFVRDLASSRSFDGDVPGCLEGRSTFKSFRHPEHVFTA